MSAPDPAILSAAQAMNRPRLMATIDTVRAAIKAMEATKK